MSETKKHKLAVLLALFFLRSGRGKSLCSRFTDPIYDILQGAVYLFALREVLGISISTYALFVIVLIKTVAEYLIGLIDQRVGFWKIENSYSANELNPHFAEMMERIKNIELMMKK